MDEKTIAMSIIDIVLIVVFNIFLVKTAKTTKICAKQGYVLHEQCKKLIFLFLFAVATGVGAFAMYWEYLRPVIVFFVSK